MVDNANLIFQLKDHLTSSGFVTFFNFPSQNYFSSHDIVMFGVPFDSYATERKGAADAPAALRRFSVKIGDFSITNQKSTQRSLLGVDIGDIIVNPFNPEDIYKTIYDFMHEIMKSGAIPIMVGGDHSISYPAISAVASHHPNLLVIQIDAHHDATDPSEWKCRYNHGTYIRNLILDGSLKADQIVQVGIRDFQWRGSGAEFVRKQGIAVYNINTLQKLGFGQLMAYLRKFDNRPTYITLDVDSIDPAFAPATGEPMVGGFYSREIIDLITEIYACNLDIVASDIVEVVPRLDSDDRTCALATHLMALMIDGLRKEESAGE